jgi:hypothetical protein
VTTLPLLPMPALGNHVSHVLCLCPKKEMFGTDAQRVVSGWAVVEHPQSGRDWSAQQFPGHSMRSERLLPIPAGADLAVVSLASTSPQPARFGLVDLRPESVSQRQGIGIRAGAATEADAPTSSIRRGCLKDGPAVVARNGDARLLWLASQRDTSRLQVAPDATGEDVDDLRDLIAGQDVFGIEPNDLRPQVWLDGRSSPRDAVAGRGAVAARIDFQPPTLDSERVPARRAVTLNDSRFRPSWHYGPPIGQADSEGLYHF